MWVIRLEMVLSCLVASTFTYVLPLFALCFEIGSHVAQAGHIAQGGLNLLYSQGWP